MSHTAIHGSPGGGGHAADYTAGGRHADGAGIGDATRAPAPAPAGPPVHYHAERSHASQHERRAPQLALPNTALFSVDDLTVILASLCYQLRDIMGDLVEDAINKQKDGIQKDTERSAKEARATVEKAERARRKSGIVKAFSVFISVVTFGQASGKVMGILSVGGAGKFAKLFSGFLLYQAAGALANDISSAFGGPKVDPGSLVTALLKKTPAGDDCANIVGAFVSGDPVRFATAVTAAATDDPKIQMYVSIGVSAAMVVVMIGSAGGGSKGSARGGGGAGRAGGAGGAGAGAGAHGAAGAGGAQGAAQASASMSEQAMKMRFMMGKIDAIVMIFRGVGTATSAGLQFDAALAQKDASDARARASRSQALIVLLNGLLKNSTEMLVAIFDFGSRTAAEASAVLKTASDGRHVVVQSLSGPARMA